jgi:predicted acetyltransferase
MASQRFTVLRARGDRVGGLHEAREVRAAAALGDQSATATQDVVYGRKQLGLVGNPVKDGCGEDDLDGLLQDLVDLGQIRLQKGDAIAERRKRRARLVKHRGRNVRGDDLAAWQPLEQLGCDMARAAARVEHTLVSRQLGPIEHADAPAGVRTSDLVVATRVPVARATAGRRRAHGAIVPARRETGAQAVFPRRPYTLRVQVRPIVADELPEWVRVGQTAFHATHSAEQEVTWRRDVLGQPTQRTLGAFDDQRIVGTLHTFRAQLTLPGGTQLCSDAITSASVLPTHRRRGVLRDMLTYDLRAAREQGELASILIAAEYPIYTRFGYGPATCSAAYTLDVHAALFTREPSGGSLELVSMSQIRELAPQLFDAFRRTQPGQIDRAAYYWDSRLGLRQSPWTQPPSQCLVYSAAGQAQGYCLYDVEGAWQRRVPHSTLVVQELIALTPDAYLSLWQYCARVDLVSLVRAGLRRVDEPMVWLLDNPRAAVREVERADFLWLRPLDLSAALAARRYACEGELVLGVDDPLGLCGGRVLLRGGVDGAECSATTRSADLELGVDALGAVMLGRSGWGSLAQAGRIDENTPGALERAAAMFGSAQAAWCSTFF